MEQDGEFWLPAEFLDEEEDVVMVQSGLTSPETESDEEDYLNELSRKLARSALEDDLWKTQSESVFANFKSSSRVLAGSRQRTLCGNLVSSRGSSNCPSATPPLSSQVESSWDVLCVAAGEIARFLLLLIFEICVEFFVCTSVKILMKVSHVLLYWSVSFLTLGLSCFVNDS
ncbi:hypothetical protein HanPSC8_Chr17g0774401 [Helianthus annuus]|nr:hypothetical protein HanIR_Chr17g0875451 [Helianthus annuus]KAJ0813527.1 hypothetical protein HanPSC8_Chr17g0774401 [Helianthus annuus]